jgi:hypothetical protein
VKLSEAAGELLARLNGLDLTDETVRSDMHTAAAALLIEEIDQEIARLHRQREQLVAAIRQGQDATGRRIDRLLRGES